MADSPALALSIANRLRAKIEPDPRRPSYIETVYGMGYRLSDRKPVAEPDRAGG